ncbi:MAG: hypothetical protein R3338_01080 [Thermoanaerobaculia bacterium]|nr:hypothetical protein [Thermoanaerobaculia bacterium]
MPLPDYDFLPAPLWLLTLLHLLTLTLHFFAMNFLLGGVLVALFGRLEDRWSNPTIRKFIILFPSVMAATITLGVAPLLFLQLVYPKQAYSAAIASGWFWLMIVGAAMLAYYLFYPASFAREGRGRKAIYLLVATISLVYISLTYSTVFSLAENPALIASAYASEQRGLVINPDAGAWIFRWGHMLLGAVTVGGFFVGLIGKSDDKVFSLGKGVYLWGLVLSSLFGVLWLFSLGEALPGLMRSNGAWYLTVAILLAVGAFLLYRRRNFILSGLALFLSMFGMVATRHALRLVRLGDALVIPVIRPQWDVFAIFLVCFLIAIGLVVWMLRMLLRGYDMESGTAEV